MDQFTSMHCREVRASARPLRRARAPRARRRAVSDAAARAAAAAGADAQGHAFIIDCRIGKVHSEFGYVPVPRDVTFLIANTNVAHSLADSPYAKRRESCDRVAAAMRARWPERDVRFARDARVRPLASRPRGRS